MSNEWIAVSRPRFVTLARHLYAMYSKAGSINRLSADADVETRHYQATMHVQSVPPKPKFEASTVYWWSGSWPSSSWRPWCVRVFSANVVR